MRKRVKREIIRKGKGEKNNQKKKEKKERVNNRERRSILKE